MQTMLQDSLGRRLSISIRIVAVVLFLLLVVGHFWERSDKDLSPGFTVYVNIVGDIVVATLASVAVIGFALRARMLTFLCACLGSIALFALGSASITDDWGESLYQRILFFRVGTVVHDEARTCIEKGFLLSTIRSPTGSIVVFTGIPPLGIDTDEFDSTLTKCG